MWGEGGEKEGANEYFIRCLYSTVVLRTTEYRHCSFYCTLLYCASQVLGFCFVLFCFLTNEKQDSPSSKSILLTGFIATLAFFVVVWNWTPNVSKVCLYCYLPSPCSCQGDNVNSMRGFPSGPVHITYSINVLIKWINEKYIQTQLVFMAQPKNVWERGYIFAHMGICTNNWLINCIPFCTLTKAFSRPILPTLKSRLPAPLFKFFSSLKTMKIGGITGRGFRKGSKIKEKKKTKQGTRWANSSVQEKEHLSLSGVPCSYLWWWQDLGSGFYLFCHCPGSLVK